MLNENKYIEISHLKSSEFSMPFLHCHYYYEIYLSLVDNVTYIVNHHQYELMKNDLLVFNSDDLHRAMPTDGKVYERYIIVINPHEFKKLNNTGEALLSCFEKRSQFFNHKVHLTQAEVDEFISILEKQPSKIFPKASLHSKLYDILVFINEKYTQNLSSTKAFEENEIYEKIRPAVDFINQNLGNKLLLDTLAELCFMEKSHFCEVFKKATGFTAHDYICYKRIVEAERHLLNGKSVQEASELVGYQSSTHFSTKFKEYWGMSPRELKKAKNSLEPLKFKAE